MTLTRIPDFGDQSARKGRCYVLNIPKPQEDEGVFRGPMIDFEGFMDISERCVKEAARELGMLDADKAAELQRRVVVLTAELQDAQTERDNFQRRAQDMILENAELVTQLQRWQAWADEPDTDDVDALAT